MSLHTSQIIADIFCVATGPIRAKKTVKDDEDDLRELAEWAS